MLRLNTFLLGVLLICELGCGTSTQPTSSQNPSGNNATPQAAASAPLIALDFARDCARGRSRAYVDNYGIEIRQQVSRSEHRILDYRPQQSP
jgi:hypothetical protein